LTTLLKKFYLRSFLLAIFSLVQPVSLYATDPSPRPPCADAPFPPYAAPHDPPNVRVWFGEDLKGDWSPPACTDWDSRQFTFLVAAAGRFSQKEGVQGLLRRIGSTSNWTTIAYWSATRGRWHNLFSEAFALSAPDRDSRRADFAVDELRPGRSLYFWQDESSLFGSAVYRLRTIKLEPDLLVFKVENEGAVKVAFLTVFDPGESQFWYFLEHEANDLWRFYSLFRVGTGTHALARSYKSSYINRAVAIFRYLGGIPTDGDPPVAR
jgi:hypothetical protein